MEPGIRHRRGRSETLQIDADCRIGMGVRNEKRHDTQRSNQTKPFVGHLDYPIGETLNPLYHLWAIFTIDFSVHFEEIPFLLVQGQGGHILLYSWQLQ